MELITQAQKFGDMPYHSDSLLVAIEELVKSPSFPIREKEEIEIVRKFFVGQKVKEELPEGQIRHIISTASVDRDGEIMEPKGADLKYYRKNPIVLWSHNYREPGTIIGKNLEIEKLENGLRALTQFDLEGYPARDIYRLYKEDFLKAWSVGFISLKGRRPEEGDKLLAALGVKAGEVRYIHEKWSLLEYSAVAVPANPEALTEAVGKALNLQDDLLEQLNLRAKEIEIEEEPEIEFLDLGTIGGGKSEDGKPEKGDEEKEEETGGSEGETASANPGGEPEITGAPEGGDKPEGDPEGDEPEETPGDAATGDPGVDPEPDPEAEPVNTGLEREVSRLTEKIGSLAPESWTAGRDFTPVLNMSGSVVGLETDMEGGQKYHFAFKDGDLQYTQSTSWPWDDQSTGGYVPWSDPYTNPYGTGVKGDAVTIAGYGDNPELKELKEELKALRDEIGGLKAGRVLSSKNRGLIQKSVEAMKSAIAALDALLAATDPNAEPEGGGEDGKGIDLSGLQAVLEEKGIDLSELEKEIEKTVDLDALINDKLKKSK